MSYTANECKLLRQMDEKHILYLTLDLQQSRNINVNFGGSNFTHHIHVSSFSFKLEVIIWCCASNCMDQLINLYFTAI